MIRKALTLAALLIAGACALALYTACNSSNKHVCRWSLCPYKGATPDQWHRVVSNYTGCEEGTDGYLIDILHLERPTLDADQLDSLLFLPTNKLSK